MEVTPATATNASFATRNASYVTTNASAISSDFDTFLRLLTVQMQNQDPLNPVDSADYAVQLATFSGVEQQVQTNELLKSLGAQVQLSGMAEFAAWVGREVRAPMAADFNGSPVTVVPTIDPGADGAELVVRNQAGVEVQRLPLSLTAGPVEWAGVDGTGAPFAPGFYSFEVVNKIGSEVLSTSQAEVYARVEEVQASGGILMLILDSGVAVPAEYVSAVRT